MKTTTLVVIEIPAVGRIAAFYLDPQNRTQVRSLIDRADAYFRLSAKAWEARQTCMEQARYEYLERREQSLADNGEALLIPLGIKCDWPGLYPSFLVHGHHEYTTTNAVLAALEHDRNWLRSAPVATGV